MEDRMISEELCEILGSSEHDGEERDIFSFLIVRQNCFHLA